MSNDNKVISAYGVAVTTKQKQELPGLDAKIRPGVEYTKLEVWDENGQPHLEEYVGAGKLKDKTGLITGGDSGIGRAVAILFSREGMKGVTITYQPPELEDAQNAKKQIEAEGARCHLVECDLTRNSDCERVVAEHIKEFGSLDVLVNNAAKQIMQDEFGDIDLDNVASTFQSNILAMFAVTKYATPHLKRGASVINSASVAAYMGNPDLVDYSSTKGAIVSFTRALAQKFAPKGIRVNAVAPGPVVTALQPATVKSAEDMEHLGAGLPMWNRAAQPAEMGPTYVYLASSICSNVLTGQVIHINNGMHVGAS